MVEKELDTKALNIKLLKFAGLNFPEYVMKYESIIPDLVNSLDEQSKYIYPKLKELRYTLINKRTTSSGWLVTIGLDNYEGLNESESLAFALAVEKLIDSTKVN